MLSLLQNEFVKIFNRPRTWVFFILPLVIMLGVTIYSKVTDESMNRDWKQEVRAEIKQSEKDLEEAKKNGAGGEDYVQIIEGDIKQKQYALDNNLSPYEKTTWTFMKEFVPISSLLGLFVIVVASDIVSSEFSKGTIKMLLIRPFSRWKILLSKFLATLLFAILLWFVTLFFMWMIGGVAYGFGGFSQPHFIQNAEGVWKEQAISTYVLANIGLEIIELAVLVTLSFMISTLFFSNSVAIGLAMLVMFTGGTIVQLLQSKEWVKYTLFANMDLTQFLNKDFMVIDDLTMPFSLAVLAVYTALMLAITFTVFQKRDVKS
ncbi:ABC transporter permease [Fictibacillus iocasae]|uniref:ABC transporter permease n=1 Tax=Fictibacillus iocasae TaxID=2715437 RepID=A0ABW2NTU9_9BACL